MIFFFVAHVVKLETGYCNLFTFCLFASVFFLGFNQQIPNGPGDLCNLACFTEKNPVFLSVFLSFVDNRMDSTQPATRENGWGRIFITSFSPDFNVTMLLSWVPICAGDRKTSLIKLSRATALPLMPLSCGVLGRLFSCSPCRVRVRSEFISSVFYGENEFTSIFRCYSISMWTAATGSTRETAQGDPVCQHLQRWRIKILPHWDYWLFSYVHWLLTDKLTNITNKLWRFMTRAQLQYNWIHSVLYL